MTDTFTHTRTAQPARWRDRYAPTSPVPGGSFAADGHVGDPERATRQAWRLVAQQPCGRSS